MRHTTIDRWQQRVARATALIATRLDEPPSLAELAAAAAISPYHFHRIWRAMTGETVGETVRRLRMAHAAHALAGSEASVTEVGLSAGFATSQAFARAFRQETGLSPTAFRASRQSPLLLAEPRDAGAAVEIVLVDPITVVAKRRTGAPYTDLAEEFGVVWAWATSAGLIDGLRGIYGVPYDDPLGTPVASLRYDACLDLGPNIGPPADLHHVPLGGGEHARLRVLGSYSGLDAAECRLLGPWLSGSGREPRDAPLFHHFHNDPETTPEAELVTDIYLPLAALAEDRPC